MLDLKIHLNQNLSEELFNIMKRCIEKCSSLPETYLFSACEKHAKDAKEEFKKNPLVDFEAAEKIAAAFAAIQGSFKSLSEEQQKALKAAMYYFALDEDEDADFESFLGFDDDVEITNVCLSFAGRDDLKVSLSL